MEAQQVIDKILSEAHVEAESILQQAREREDEALAKVEDQIDQFNKETDVVAEQTAAAEKAHILATARMETTQQRLTVKRELLDQVFQQAQHSLKNLPEKEYRDLMIKRMIEVVETGDEEVLVNKDDKRIDQGFIKQVNRQLGPGFKGNLRLAEDKMDQTDGFILRRGRILTNVTFQVMIAQARKELEVTLAKDMFAVQTKE
jgi:vacuolar-type H+-ATPase subunit E/Vma4